MLDPTTHHSVTAWAEGAGLAAEAQAFRIDREGRRVRFALSAAALGSAEVCVTTRDHDGGVITLP